VLILSRKPGEKIIIGENIQITVVAIRGNQVRLGFTAPGDVPIYREEISPAFAGKAEEELCKAGVGE
jgi:carbon storage regulator